MITEEDIEKALDWLRANADKAAAARANRVYVEEYLKVIKAEQMKVALTQEHSSAVAQEREALISSRYQRHLTAIQEAVQEDERYRWLQRTAEAKIEAWRSMQANNRAQGKA